ncbi:MAG: response regulator transcription factor [Pseudomonadota bacterium]
MRVLVVEDDEGIARGLAANLRRHGWAVDVSGDLCTAWAALRAEPFDAVLLDLGLPDGDGTTLLRNLRARSEPLPDPSTPVLIMTARDTVGARIEGLDLGADDYVTKPFDFDEVAARLRALRRRAAGRASPVLTHGASKSILRHTPFAAMANWWNCLRVNLTVVEIAQLETEKAKAGHLPTLDLTASYNITRNPISPVQPGAVAALPVQRHLREQTRHHHQTVLVVLVEASPRVLSRSQIEARMYNWEAALDSNAIEVHIHRLRRKLGENLIRTVRGVGYFVPQQANP